MSKNLIVILYFSLAAVAVVVVAVVSILAPEQFDKLFQGLLQVLGLASTAAVTIYLLGKQASTLEDVRSQTNGTNTALREENTRLQQQLLQIVGSSPTAPKASSSD